MWQVQNESSVSCFCFKISDQDHLRYLDQAHKNWWEIWERRNQQAPKWEPAGNSGFFKKKEHGSSDPFFRPTHRLDPFRTLPAIVNWFSAGWWSTTFLSPCSLKIKTPKAQKQMQRDKILHTSKPVHCNILPLCINHVPTDGRWYQGLTTAVGAAANVWGKPCKRSWHFSVIRKPSNFQSSRCFGFAQDSHMEQCSKWWHVEWRTYHTKSPFKVVWSCLWGFLAHNVFHISSTCLYRPVSKSSNPWDLFHEKHQKPGKKSFNSMVTIWIIPQTEMFPMFFKMNKQTKNQPWWIDHKNDLGSKRLNCFIKINSVVEILDLRVSKWIFFETTKWWKSISSMNLFFSTNFWCIKHLGELDVEKIQPNSVNEKS